MSSLKIINLQIGQSGTATQNFTLNVPASPDGTIKLARGNIGSTTQDLLTIDSSGKLSAGVAPVAGVRSAQLATMQMFADEFTASKASPGWQKLSSGIIIQWGTLASGSGAMTITFPIAFPTACVGSSLTVVSATTSGVIWSATVTATSTTTLSALRRFYNGSTLGDASESVSWIAIGY